MAKLPTDSTFHQMAMPMARLSGIYFLCDGDEVVYVGKAADIHFRIATHIHDSIKKFDSVYYRRYENKSETLRRAEDFWIFKLKPKYNGNSNGDGFKAKGMYQQDWIGSHNACEPKSLTKRS